MKKYISITTIIICLFLTVLVYAQTGSTSGTKYQYCEFTWEIEWYNGKIEKRIGKIVLPGGLVENHNQSRNSGLNYLGGMGWELCTAYVEDGDGWRNYVYSFRKRQ